MKKRIVLASSTMIAVALAAALILRPQRTIPPGPELPAPEHIPPAARATIKAKMGRHGEQLATLVSRAVVLDYDGVARAGGAIFDEPGLARPAPGTALDGLLPERFFALQAALQTEARLVVEAAARRDSASLAGAFGALTSTCISCHEVYLRGTAP